MKKSMRGLRDMVEQTFNRQAPQVEMQQKTNAKFLQYEGYKERRPRSDCRVLSKNRVSSRTVFFAR
jgi:hypothetical protein